MKLYCVRHGEAESVGIDLKKGLSAQGRHDVGKVARCLSGRNVVVDHLLHSGKERAKQTADILSSALDIKQIDVAETLLEPEAYTQPLVNMISSWDQDTMIVGHLPFLAKLVSALVIDNDAYYPIVTYPPGTIVCLEFYEGRRWIINWILQPAILSDE